jgi:hypothetical protein
MKKRINWEEIRNKYIYGIQKDGKLEFPSQRDLADEYNIDPAVIGRQSSKESWAKAREDYISERSAKSQQKVVEEISDKIAPFDTFLFEKVDKFVRGVGGLIDHIFPESNPEDKEPLKATDLIVFKTSDLFSIITSLKIAKELEKAILGEGTKGDKSLADELLALLGKNVNDR